MFSIGFVKYSSPRRWWVAECGKGVNQWPVTAVWNRNDNCCGPQDCLSRGSICAPTGDAFSVLFSIYDNDGDEFDLSGAQEIVFAVADKVDGTVRFVKSMTDGGIVISTNGYQFAVYLDSEDTSSVVQRRNYYEARVTDSAGRHKTVSVGAFIAPKTMIKDIQ